MGGSSRGVAKAVYMALAKRRMARRSIPCSSLLWLVEAGLSTARVFSERTKAYDLPSR